jgi:hypothetical protein
MLSQTQKIKKSSTSGKASVTGAELAGGHATMSVQGDHCKRSLRCARNRFAITTSVFMRLSMPLFVDPPNFMELLFTRRVGTGLPW